MIGSGRETMAGLAAGLSAAEDRELLTQLNVDNTFEFSPTFEVTSQGSIAPSNSGVMLEALNNFEPNLMGFDDALDPSETGIDETFFSKDDPLLVAIMTAGGIPWPTPWTEPDDWAVSGQNYQNTAGVPINGFEGGLFAESLQGLEAPASAAGKNLRKEQLKAVVVAAFEPGTTRNRKTVKRLLDQSIRLAALAEKRALVTKRARDAFEANLREVTRMDVEIARLLPLVFSPNGDLQKTATEANLKRILDLRKKNLELGRKTVRLQKLNMLASAITHNTLVQVVTVQNMAQAVATGSPEALTALGLAFDRLGRENAKIKKLRQRQLERWDDKRDVQRARSFSGLDGFDALYGFDAVEVPFDEMENNLAALEFSLKKTWRKAKRGVKKLGRSAGKIVKEVGGAGKILAKATVVAPLKGTVKAAKRIAKGDVKGAFKAVGQSVVDQAKGLKDFAAKTILKWGCDIANTRAFKIGVKAVGQAAGTVVGAIVAQPTIGGAIGTEAGGQAANMQRNTCGAMNTIGLTKGTFRPGRIDNAAKAFAKRAWRETLSPKAQLRSLKNIATNAIGGQFSAAFNVGGVDVMSKIGLDPNKLVTNNPVLQNLYKQGTSKLQGKLQSEFQKSAGGLLRQAGIPFADQIVSMAQSGQLHQYASLLRNVSAKDLTAMSAAFARDPKSARGLLRQAGIPFADQIVSMAQSGQLPQYASLLRNVSVKDLTAMGAALARDQARGISQRKVGETLTRVVPGLSVRAGVSNALRANAAARLRIAGQLSPASVEPAQGPLPMLSKYVSTPTEDALPYVGSIGRDY